MRPLLIALALTSAALADGPADNMVDAVRPIPPKPKTALTADERRQLEAGVAELGKAIESLKVDLAKKPALLELLPDVQVYHNAVRYAVAHDEIFDPKKEVPFALKHIEGGLARAAALKEGKTPWLTQTGLVVRGYKSRLDDSVQPYGLVVPPSFNANSPYRHRLDIWCHGRGETLSEVNFIQDRSTNPGQFTPRDAIVLHPYGRYCNANKFAGEVDCFEAIDHLKKHYRIDDDRIVMRGFSMGGAACWQFAVHYPDRFCAAAPGAGFSETAKFLNVFQNEQVEPPDYERKLWGLYDCPDYVVNLNNIPVVAYSGEIDKQKQAADVMAEAMKPRGLELVHLIGPKTGHSYHPDAKREVDRRIDAIAEIGRDAVPPRVRFQTKTLRYNRSFWLRIDGLSEHWTNGEIGGFLDPDGVQLQSIGVTAVTIAFPPGRCPWPIGRQPLVNFLGDRKYHADPKKSMNAEWKGIRSEARVLSDRSYESHWVKEAPDTPWRERVLPDEPLRKRHGSQGPIDDAFMERFLMVRPTGKPAHELVGKWCAAEMEHAITHWRQQFRGEARVRDDKDVTGEDIADSNLVLWGDPSSNTVLARIADRLPIKWTKDTIVVGNKTFHADGHVPVMIFPNPLNPKKYVVLNSGFTFREYDYLNNARQVPKLPDWAIIDARSPRTSRAPGKVMAADFFDEAWQLKK